MISLFRNLNNKSNIYTVLESGCFKPSLSFHRNLCGIFCALQSTMRDQFISFSLLIYFSQLAHKCVYS